MTDTLGIGLIGCGNIAKTYLRLAPLFRGIEVRACADISMETATALGRAFGVPAVTPDALLADPRIDAVVNLTVPAAHADVTISALGAGKHVYSEKPLALNLADGLRIRSVAERQGRLVACAPDTILGGAPQLARNLVDAGQLGRVTSGTAHVLSHGMESWHPNPGFFYQPGGGPILDLGPYYITALVNLLGPVRRVAALAHAATPTRTLGTPERVGETIPVATPTTIAALLEFASGAAVTLMASWDVWAHRHPNLELYGTEGTLFLPDPNYFGGTLVIARPDGTHEDVPAPAHPFGEPNQDHPAGRVANYRAAGLADLADALRAGRAPRCSLDLSLHVLDVMTGILRSGETAAFVDLETSCERPEPLSPDAARALRAECGTMAGGLPS